MIEVYTMLWVMAIFFGIIGIMRGWAKEIVATAGIILATFALFQFDNILRGVLLATVPRDQAFFVQVGLFSVIVYFAYQSRMVVVERSPENRNRLQNAVLGALLGAFNGYLIWGAVWYFLDINEYPLNPLIVAPGPNSPSAQNLNAIPLVLIGGGAGGGGELLTLAVILLFLFVLFML